MRSSKSRRRILRCERFESREVPTVVPVGPEFRVNNVTTVAVGVPAAALDGAGNFVIAWQAFSVDGSDNAILAQRYDAGGKTLGPQFQVNTYVTGSQQNPVVAADAGGRFVVVWGSATQQDGSREGVYARVYDSNGAPLSGEILVNQFTLNIQGQPSVAMDQDGDFVVAWETNYQDGDGYGIYARRFNNFGAPQGNEFPVNSTTFNDQRYPAVACDQAGNFIVTWEGVDSDQTGIRAQRFAADGTPLGDEFAVNQTTTGQQTAPTIAADADGDFAIAWASTPQDGGTSGIYVRRYSGGGGAALGSETRVNSTTTGDQIVPALASSAAGDLTVTWQSLGQDGDGWGIYCQYLSPSGTKVGNEFRVTTTTTGNQTMAAVAATPNGDCVVAWVSEQSPFDGIISQRFVNPPIPTAKVTIDDGHPQRSNIASISIDFNTIVNIVPGAIVLSGPVGLVNLVINSSASTNTETRLLITFTGPSATPNGLINGDYSLGLYCTQITNLSGERLDGDGNGTQGPNLVLSFHRMFGDMDADRDVDANDFAYFRRYLGTFAGDGIYRHYLDWDADGDVDITDFGRFRQAFGNTLPEP